MSPYTRTSLLYLVWSALPQLLCWALLWVARTSQGVAAADALPLVVLVLVGLLFVGGMYRLSQQLPLRHKPLVMGAALALNLLSAWILPLPFIFVIAPLVAILAGESYRVFGSYAPMLAAMSVYIVCTLLANFTFDSFLALPVYGQLSVGTLFFGVTFTQRDRVHAFGKIRAYQMIAASACANLALSAYLGIPLRFLLAGFLAIVIAETVDTEVYSSLIKRRWLTRVLTSNAFSIPLDSVTFTAIAFAGTLSVATMSEIVFADIVAKTVVGFLAATRVLRRTTPLTASPPHSHSRV